ncbi:Unknown protein sequence [Pseudomonas syringae pv. maculicola]|nr:Unknown protein sequence [Pseudomonas syringae pv. maculicola]
MGKPSFIHDSLAAFKVQLTCFRELNPASGAVQETQSNHFLETAYSP